MSRPYDITTRHLVGAIPTDWPALCGRPAQGPVRVLDTDLSTVAVAADAVLHIGEHLPWLLHLEMQASRDIDLVLRCLKYNVLIRDAHRLPVSTVVFLLRPAADGPELTGQWSERHHINDEESVFRYRTVRVWQLPWQQIAAGGLGTLPLAMLCDDAAATPEPVIERLHERLDPLPDRPLAAEL